MLDADIYLTNYLNLLKDKLDFRKILAICLLCYCFLSFKAVFFASLFVLADIFTTYVNLKYKIDLIFDFLLIGIIFVSYYFSLKIGLIMCAFIILTRLMYGELNRRHFVKLPIMVLLAVLSNLFNQSNFLVIGFFLVGLRYIMEYLIDWHLTGQIGNLDRIHRRVIHIFGAYLFFSYFCPILVMFV